MIRSRLYITIALGFLICSGPAIFAVSNLHAQSGGQAGAFQRMGFGPRGMAMGNAMTAFTTDGVYGYYNPALAALRKNHSQFDISTAVMEFDRTLNMVSSHFDLPPAAGLGFYILHAGVSNIDGRTSSGYHTELLSTHDYQLGTQFAVRFHEQIWGGIGMKLNRADYHNQINSSTGIGFDFGLKAAFNERFSAGFTVQDLLASHRWNASDLYGDSFGSSRTYAFPLRVKTGAVYEAAEELQISAEFEYRLQKNYQDNGFEAENSLFLRVGSRYRIHERLTIRAGIRSGDLEYDAALSFSGGFSLHLPFDRYSPSVDYAFVQETNRVANLHLFALRLHI